MNSCASSGDRVAWGDAVGLGVLGVAEGSATKVGVLDGDGVVETDSMIVHPVTRTDKMQKRTRYDRIRFFIFYIFRAITSVG